MGLEMGKIPFPRVSEEAGNGHTGAAQETVEQRAQAWHFGLVSDGAREWARRARELAGYREARLPRPAQIRWSGAVAPRAS